MTLPTEFLAALAGILERLAIPYHVGGSVASSAHGMYRTSADIDIVIGGETSERQWLDVRSILVANRGALDEAHLDRWASELGVADLLERARREAAEV